MRLLHSGWTLAHTGRGGEGGVGGEILSCPSFFPFLSLLMLKNKHVPTPYLGTHGVRVMTPPQPQDPIVVTYKLYVVDLPPPPSKFERSVPSYDLHCLHCGHMHILEKFSRGAVKKPVLM